MKTTTLALASSILALTRAVVVPINVNGNVTKRALCTRQSSSDYETEVEVGQNTVTAVWVYTANSGQNKDNHPSTEAFTELFDNVYNMCGPTQCGLDQSQPMEYCTWPLNPELAETGGGPQICLQATGSFGSASKDEIFSLGRAAFDGSVKREYFDVPDVLLPEVHETGTSFIHIVTGPAFQGGSGYDLSFNLKYEANDEGCGVVTQRIADAGALVPTATAPVFGLVGLVCNLV